MNAAAVIARAQALDAEADAHTFTPSGRMARLRVQKLFEKELAVKRSAPVLSVCPITGARVVSIPSVGAPPVAGPSSDEIAVFDFGGAVAPLDFPHFAAIARQRALARMLEGRTEEQINAEAQLAGQIPPPITEADLLRLQGLRVECEGPQIDIDTQTGEAAEGSDEDEPSPFGEPVGFFADHFEGEADFRALCRNETGRILSVEAAEERLAAFRLQCEQTERLADALEATGWKVRHVDPSQVGQPGTDGRSVRPALSFIPIGQPDKVLTLPNVQRLNAFPTVAASRRAETLRSLRYFLEREGGSYVRMATITGGTRLRESSRLENLNAENKRLHRAIGELVRHRLFKRHGEPVALGMEFGTPVPFMGGWHLHHHGHLLWNPVLPPAADWKKYRETDLRHPTRRLARFRRWLRLRMAALLRYEWKEKGFVWRERDRGIWAADEIHAELGKRIQNAAEVCKYPVKPADLDVLLNEAGPAAIRTFFEQVKGLRLFTAYGDLRRLRSKVKDAGKRFVSITTPDGKVIAIRKNWNLSGSDRFEQKRRARMKSALRRRLRPEVIEKRRQKTLRRFAKKMRRPLWRLYQITQKEADAARAIAEGRNVATNQTYLAGLALERRAHFVFIRDTLETFPRSFHETGLADQIAAPWLADLRAFLASSHSACAFENVAENEAGASENEKRDPENDVKKPIRNRVLARCAPFASGQWRIAQPTLAVVGYCGDFAALRQQNDRVAALADFTAAHIAACLRTQAAMDALPDERAPYAGDTRDTRATGARARVRGSHYPHNSQGVAETWPPTAEFWPAGAEKTALAGAAN